MEKRTLGRGGPAISAIGFGAMPLSIQGRPDERTAISVIQAVSDAGVSVIDTANVYCLDNDDIGHNERLIVKARGRGDPAKPMLVATKGGLTRPRGRWESDGRPDRLKRACEQSLRDLGVDCIDLYQLHAPDPRVAFADSIGALAELQREGKIRWIGLSNVSIAEIREAESIVKVLTVQNRLNVFFRAALTDGVVEYCQRRGIGFFAYSPLGGSQYNRRLPEHRVLRAIAARHARSAHAVALAWLLAQAPNIIPIPGARSAAHALDSARAFDFTLDTDELTAISEARF
jgi:aryl-alcohol dehydrogenase-like predicted oxidoreductase